MLLRDVFPKSKTKFIDIVDKYTILEDVQGIRMRDFVWMSCKDCGHEFSQRANNIFSQGIISCKCSKSYRKTKEELLDVAVKYCTSKDLVVSGIEYLQPLTESILSLECKICEFKYDTPYGHLIFNKTGCVLCSQKYQPTLEEYDHKIKEAFQGKFKLEIPLIGSPTKNTQIEVRCLSCNKTSNKLIAAVIYHKPSCPFCAVYGYDESTSGFMYLIKLYNDSDEYYKIGVTCNLERRFRELSSPNGLNIEVINTWKYNSNEPILKHESFIKEHFSLGRTNEKPFEYGYTEVVPKECLPVILAIQNLQYRNMSGGFTS